jgi:hypothetical protein
MIALFASERRGLPVASARPRRFFQSDPHAQAHAADREHETRAEPFHR